MVGKTLELDREGAAKVIISESTARIGKTQVDIRALKQWVASKLGSSSLLRRVVASEPDRIPAEELVGKVWTWLAILEEDLEA